MMNDRKLRSVVVLTVLCLCCSSVYARKSPTVYMFGPTGIHGTISKQTIQVKKVDKGSPADGKIAKKSIIRGIGQQSFKGDVRRAFARAINVAETEAAGGNLSLLMDDNSKVDLQLEVLGSYSATAPFNCPKSNLIITRAADYIVKRNKYVPLKQDLLGLLATGEQKYLDVVREQIHADKMLQPDSAQLESILTGEVSGRYLTWQWGYSLILYGEYYLMTKDPIVLPAIEAYAVTLARGQDASGLWGHSMASEALNGRLPGYAQINQPSLTVLMGMILAKKCGVDDPRLDQAIEKTHAFYDNFVGKGALNYGVHGPNTRTFNNNGTSGSAALDMALMGNRKGAAFFSLLSAASYNKLEDGHTGHYFNMMWTPLGANLLGPRVSVAFFNKARWLHTINRGWNGQFTFNGGEYKNSSSTGSHLLWLCVSRRKLLITGRDADPSLRLREEAAEKVIALPAMDYKSKSAGDLLELVDHPVPQVRRRAKWFAREHREEILPRLDALMSTGTKEEKMFAVSFHGQPQDKKLGLPYLDKIGAILRNPQEDAEVRAAAAEAIAYMGEPARKYYVDIVRMIAEDRPWDRFGDIDESLGVSINQLCAEPFAAGLVEDPELHYKAALKLIRHKRQDTRGDGVQMLKGMPLEDFSRVGDALVYMLSNEDRSYHSYHNPMKSLGAAIGVLSDLNIKEGMDYAIAIGDIPSGKGSFIMRAMMDGLTHYGAHAKPYVDALVERPNWPPRNRRLRGKWNHLMQTIKEDTNPAPLISIDEAMQAGKR